MPTLCNEALSPHDVLFPSNYFSMMHIFLYLIAASNSSDRAWSSSLFLLCSILALSLCFYCLYPFCYQSSSIVSYPPSFLWRIQESLAWSMSCFLQTHSARYSCIRLLHWLGVVELGALPWVELYKEALCPYLNGIWSATWYIFINPSFLVFCFLALVWSNLQETSQPSWLFLHLSYLFPTVLLLPFSLHCSCFRLWASARHWYQLSFNAGP